MRRMGKSLLTLAFLVLICAGLACDPPPVEQSVETVIGQDDATTFSLSDGSQRIVGTVTVTQQGTAMRIRVNSSPGQRLADVRICVMPECTRTECVYWMGPEEIDVSGHDFTVNLDNLQAQICTIRFRVLVRYRVVPTSG